MEIASRFFMKNKEHSILKNRLSILIFLLTLFTSSTPSGANAQVDCSNDTYFNDMVTIDLNSLIFPINLWRIEDLLNVKLVNNSSESMDVYLVASITEVYRGRIYDISSVVFNLPPGPLDIMNPPELEPVDVDEFDSKFSKYAQDIAYQTGSLPAGEYIICVCAYDPSGNTCYGHDCVTQVIAHPSPPELIYPVNESVVMEDLPVFSWLPPMPSAGEIKYTIEIVELLDGQVPVEAMESNYKWLLQSVNNQTSLLYPVAGREFIHGTRYAWRIEAIMGPIDDEMSGKIKSPVWSFTFMGTKGQDITEQYLVNLKTPGNNMVMKTPPFFEWELTDPASQKVGEMALDENIYFDVKIWKVPDNPVAGNTDLLLNDLANNPAIEPYYEANRLSTTYFNFPESDADTLKDNYFYIWKVVCFKDEMIIAESGSNQFSVLSDKIFFEAAESMLDTVKLEEDSKIYGITETVPAGALILSEEPSDLDTIGVNNALYLFIIDDDPYSRFGHPVRYALVDKETRSVTEYNANWFPEVKNVEDPWDTKGVANVNGNEINVLTPRSIQESSNRQREIADIADIMQKIDCGNYVLMIDCGDRNRTGTADNIASSAARDADSLQALYEKRHYHVERFSQYWDYKNEKIKSIPVDTTTKAGANFLKEFLIKIKEHYVSLECCAGSKFDFEFVIYINANTITATNKFKIYKADGSGVCENIDYFRDILRYLQTLPQCVKITLFIDANFSGPMADAQLLDSYLKRGNYEIRTATDAVKTTPSGVAKQKPAGNNKPVSKKPGTGTGKELEASITEITAALEKIDEMNVKQESGKINLGDSYAKVNETINRQSDEFKRVYPNPKYTRLHLRDEYSLLFPVLKNQSEIKDCRVIPDRSANIILNKENGLVTVFSKIKGEINVIVTYENGSEEIKLISSKWGDGT